MMMMISGAAIRQKWRHFAVLPRQWAHDILWYRENVILFCRSSTVTAFKKNDWQTNSWVSWRHASFFQTNTMQLVAVSLSLLHSCFNRSLLQTSARTHFPLLFLLCGIGCHPQLATLLLWLLLDRISKHFFLTVLTHRSWHTVAPPILYTS